MFSEPDLSTLQLCSVLASAGFMLICLWQWRGQRSTLYLAHWAFSLILYIAAIAGFDLATPDRGVITGALLFAMLAGSNIFVASGVALFEGRRPFAAWMPVPVPAIGCVVAFVIAGRDAAACGLMLGMALFGTMLLRGAGGAERGRRIAGVALLAYVPGYLCAIIGERTAIHTFDLLASITMLSDQMLLTILYLGLLSMPGDRALRRLRMMALRDPMTGAWNRAWLMQEDPRLAAAGSAVVLIDVAHFKAINDRHGHAAGDAVLIGLARRVGALAEAWGGDLVRIGGDEFAAILPAGMAAAARFAESVRIAAADHLAGTISCTVSVGVGRVAAGERRLDPAMARADGSLYRAKAAGRDRVAA